MIKTKKIRSYEKGLYFKDEEFRGILGKGRHWFVDPLFNVKVNVASMRDPWLIHDNLDLMVKSGLLDTHVRVLDLEDCQRALVWVEGRFERILGPGPYALWKDFKKLRIEVIDAREVRFAHEAMNQIVKNEDAVKFLLVVDVPEGHKCVYFKDGKYVETLPAGRHLFWTRTAVNRFFTVDLREKILDVAGQEIMTSDKVTLRINAMLSFSITDALKSVSLSEDSQQALYREAQLALRSVIGTLELDLLEKVVSNSKMNVVLGEKGFADRVVNLL